MKIFLTLFMLTFIGCSKDNDDDLRSDNGKKGSEELVISDPSPAPSAAEGGDGNDQKQSGNTSGNQASNAPVISYATGIKSGDLLPAIPQSNFVPSRNTFHGLALSRTGIYYLASVTPSSEVSGTSLDKIGIHQRSIISDIVDLGSHGVAISGSLYLANDPLTNILEAQTKMHVVVIVDPNGAVTLVDQNLAGRTDQQVLTVNFLTFDNGKRLYFLSNNRVRYIDLETREVFSATSDKLNIERFELARPSGKIYLRGRNWRTSNRYFYELTPELEARPLFPQSNSYIVRENLLWTQTGLFQDLNAWNNYFLKWGTQVPVVSIQPPTIDVAGSRLNLVGPKTATLSRGIPPSSFSAPVNGRLSFDGSNLFGFEVVENRLKIIRKHNLKYPIELANLSSFSNPIFSMESPGTADSPFWMSISNSDAITLLRFTDFANVPEKYTIPNIMSGSKVLKADNNLYLFSGNLFFQLEVTANGATATSIATPPWSIFDLAHGENLYDVQSDRILKYNFTTAKWDELFRISIAGCFIRKNSLVLGANGGPLGIMEVECGAARGVYAVSYVSWEDLNWETSSKLTNKIFSPSTFTNTINHSISQGNQNLIRVDNSMIVLSDALAPIATIELKIENVDPLGWNNLSLPADLHPTGSTNTLFGPNSAIIAEAIQSPLRRTFAADLNAGTTQEIEAMRGADLIESQPVGDHYFLAGEKNGGAQSVAIIVKPDLSSQTLPLPESLDILRLVKRP